MSSMWNAVDRVLGFSMKWLTILMFGIIFILLVLNVVVRWVPIVSLGWYDEIIEMLVAWTIFMGTAALWRDKDHFALTFLPDALKGKLAGRFVNVLIDLVGLFFLGIFAYYSYTLTERASDWTPILKMPKRLLYACMPLSSALMILYSLRDIVHNICGAGEK